MFGLDQVKIYENISRVLDLIMSRARGEGEGIFHRKLSCKLLLLHQILPAFEEYNSENNEGKDYHKYNRIHDWYN